MSTTTTTTTTRQRGPLWPHRMGPIRKPGRAEFVPTHHVYLLNFIVQPNSLESMQCLGCYTHRLHTPHHRAPSCENMTSSTKPEVRKASQRRRRKNERRSEAACTRKSVTFGREVSGMCELADKNQQIDIPITRRPSSG